VRTHTGAPDSRNCLTPEHVSLLEVAVSHRPVAETAPTATPPSSYEQVRRKRASHADLPLRLLPSHDAPGTTLDILPRPRSELLSRALNVAIAGSALVAASPVLAAVALLVKLTSPGPVLYAQTRIGVDRRFRERSSNGRRLNDHGGKPFRMYKFRTMHVNAEPDGRAVWAVREDPRVTRVGAVLRRLRIDELPQLYNVLRGDMNIVGPRPERPSIFAELRETIPEYPVRQRVKPGITGWAQINQAYDSCVDDVRRKVEYDLEYLRRQSVIEDLRIMSLTIPVMIFRRGGW
jgi:lipopolysaccharide/colanic/teichoic acid biosynthesis glycosyltransferase